MFESLPRRLFLDSSTLQTLLVYGNTVFEGEEQPRSSRAHEIPDLLTDLEALGLIFAVNERAGFEFVLSERSLAEVAAKGDPRYMRWAFDVRDHWLACVEEYGGDPLTHDGAATASDLNDPSFGYLAQKDKLLLADALEQECDAFLTMEKKLTKNAGHLEARAGLRILRPPQYWELLAPWAALYR